jgi:hypothetical protein
MFESATNTYRLVKINTSYTNKFISNTIEKLNIINEGNLKKYDKSKEFEKLIKHENMIRRHPSFLKIISENNNIIKCRWINLTHSPDDIKINQQNITKTKVSSYIKDAFYKFKKGENCDYICDRVEFIEEKGTLYGTLYVHDEISCDCIRKFMLENELKKIQTIIIFKKALSLIELSFSFIDYYSSQFNSFKNLKDIEELKNVLEDEDVVKKDMLERLENLIEKIEKYKKELKI